MMPDALNSDTLETILRLLDTELTTKFGIEQPRIVVCGLNPHAGEGGQLGTEEITTIGPAVEQLRSEGLDVQGPVPADAVFVSASNGEFDGVVCMYHDQANIARKLQPMNQGATIFVGLPVAYGTTAHGTAFDIAGQGVADPGSLLADHIAEWEHRYEYRSGKWAQTDYNFKTPSTDLATETTLFAILDHGRSPWKRSYVC